MTCTTCGFENPVGIKFCGECGNRLVASCPQCGAHSPAGFKFCGECGASLLTRPVQAPEKSEARKVVTIIFADLIGSTALHERLDAESARHLMDRYYRALRGAVETHGGTVVKLMGDGVMAAFGVPRVAEDDAIRAVRGAVAMQQSFRELADAQSAAVGDIGLRVAVNTGEVVVSAANDDVVGDPVNVAARLQQEARDGEVIIGEPTRRLVSELVTLARAGVFALKGRSETVAAYRVVSLDRPPTAAAIAFVGRDEELRRVMAVYDTAVTERRARLAVVLGSPGLGKSRLLDEVGRRLGDGATVLTVRCEAAAGATFAPIARAVRAVLRIDDGSTEAPPSTGLGTGFETPVLSTVEGPPKESGSSGRTGESLPLESNESGSVRAEALEARGGVLQQSASGDALRAGVEAAIPAAVADGARIADGIAALLAGTPASPEETFFIVRRFLAALATPRPVVLAIDDLQWAEPLLLDLIEHLVQWGRGIPLLLLAGARPDLRELRSSLTATGALVSEVLTLSGLDAGAATRLAANVIGADLPAAVAGRVLATSEGNPLFLSELVRMLVNDGVLKREGERWIAAVDLATFEMPPTIHALLAARIERLRPEDRTVLERAAVIGRQFSRGAVAHLLPREITDLDARFESLRRSEVIEPDTGWYLGEPALRFHHGLTRDAAYRRVLKGTRAELHERLADWIATKVGDAIEHDELLGWHLEQAQQHLRELGPLDARGKALGGRAARHLGAAGRRALARDDASVAADLLGRALNVLDAPDPARADLALDWCEALLAAGDVVHARAAIDELGRFIGDTPSAPSPTHFLSVGEGRGEGAGGVDASAAPSRSDSLTLPSPTRKERAGEGTIRLSAWHTCFTGQLAVLTDPQALRGTVDALAAAAAELAALGDAAGEAKAHQVHAQALQRLGSIGACEAVLDKALAAARSVGDRRRSNAVLAGAPQAALWGPSPVTRASGRCLDVVRVLRITQGAPAVEAVALRCQAVLEALRGRTDAARRMITSSRKMVEELGITQQVLETDTYIGLIELLEEDAAAAERSLRPAYEGFRAHELGIDAARAGALLGRALFMQGNAAEAETLSHESEALAGDDLQAAIAWRRVRAEALAARGEHAAAVEVARAAVDIAAATDALLLHANARMALATALRAAGRRDEAAAEEARAIELWEAKGATLLVERARRGEQALPSRSLPLQKGGQEGFESSEQIPLSPPFSKGEARPELVHTARRVRPNAATSTCARLDAAMAARDEAALPALLADDYDVTEHTTGDRLDRHRALAGLRSFLRVQDLKYEHEPLATLGSSLALLRSFISGSGVAGAKFDVGAYDTETLILREVDAQGRLRHTDLFPANRLGDAITRLYERYAELLPNGPERSCAAATARSVAGFWGGVDIDRGGMAHSPAVEFVDHRPLGFPPTSGIEAYSRRLATLREVSDDSVLRPDDILALRSDALLARCTNFGTARVGGGAFERQFLMLWSFGTDGLMTRHEMFDLDRDAEALARFNELTGEVEPINPSVSPLGKGRTKEGSGRARRVQPNAATANAARLSAVIAARDADALIPLVADEAEVVHRPMHSAYGSGELLRIYRALIRAENGALVFEPLATLGDSLALGHQWISASGASGEKFDIGPYEVELVSLLETDEQGRRRYCEFFAADKLGDAIVRLYERYAEPLPNGPERTRAATAARLVAALTAEEWDVRLHRDATLLSPALEFVDHRALGLPLLHGAEEFLRGVQTIRETTVDNRNRFNDLLALRSDALLVRCTNFGTLSTGGGAFERQFLQLFVFGADGPVIRWEHFDVDREEQALARFEELTGGARDHARHAGSLQSLPPRTRGAGIQEGGVDSRQKIAGMTERPHPAGRVRPNAATAHAARLDAAVAARDATVVSTTFSNHVATVDHSTGVTYDRPGAVARLQSLFKAQDLSFHHEPIATLGDRLALSRQLISYAGLADGDIDVGPVRNERIWLHEVDEHGQLRRSEQFATDHLGDAIVRLYERYAELLPEGPERERAAATARSFAAFSGPLDVTRFATGLAADVEFIDHQTLGLGSMHGAAAFQRVLRSLVEVGTDIAVRDDDVLALSFDALLTRSTTSGTDRIGGGAFERRYLRLYIFGADGFLTRMEQFDVGREVEALARFDEVTERRRVQPNAATAAAARLDAAMMARDDGALPGLLADDYEGTEETVGDTFSRRSTLAYFRSMLRVKHLGFRHEPRATLGNSLALFQASFSGSGTEGGRFDVGPYQTEMVIVSEADAQGRLRRSHLFPTNRLGDAIARLYARYAELLPEGPERVRATAIARSIAMTGEWARNVPPRFAPTIEVVDYRILGTWSARGAEATGAHIHAVLELADNVATRRDDVLGLRPDALLVRATHSGTLRAGGGPYERQFLMLDVFGSDGLIARKEYFDVDRDAEALARFDELTAEHPSPSPLGKGRIEEGSLPPTRRRVRPNAATANAAQLDAAFESRRIDALPTLTEDYEHVHHPTRITYGRLQTIDDWHGLFSGAEKIAIRHKLLATLGESLALVRYLLSYENYAAGAFDVGAVEKQEIVLIEVDAQGHRRRTECFAADRLRDACYRLYERYGELLPPGPERERAATIARTHAVTLHPLDAQDLAAMIAPTFELIDHRTLGFAAEHGAEAFLRGRARALLETAQNVSACVDDVLVLRCDALLTRGAVRGIDRSSGGEFELPSLDLTLFGADGLVTRIEQFDPDREDEALARFDELTGTGSPRPLGEGAERMAAHFANAATRAWDRFFVWWHARDWARIVAWLPPEYRRIDRRALVRVELDRDQSLEFMRPLFDVSASRIEIHPLATRGDRLALSRFRFDGNDALRGPTVIEYLAVLEVNERGDAIVHVNFDLDDLDAAYAELDARFAAGEGAAFPRPQQWSRAFVRAGADRDVETLAALLAPDFVVHDHSPLGWGVLERAAYVESVKALFALSTDLRVRVEHLRLCERGLLMIGAMLGTHEGGAFEQVRVVVSQVDADGRERRRDMYALDQLDQARAQFEALRQDPLHIPPNAATRAHDRLREYQAAGDWNALRALVAPVVFDDRRRLIRLTGDADMFVAHCQQLQRAAHRARCAHTLLATAGDRLELEHQHWTTVGGRAPFELDLLHIEEVDDEGHIIADIALDPDDRRAAALEMLERYARSDEARDIPLALFEALRAVNAHDLEGVRAALRDDFALNDHRRTGLGRLDRAAYLASLAALFEQAPDVSVETLYIVAVEKHGVLMVARNFGTLREGGEFESVYARIMLHQGDRLIGVEMFEPEDLDKARARFAELRPDPLRIPPNAASRARDRAYDLVVADDLESVRALASADFVYEDRGRRALVSEDVEVWLKSIREVRSWPNLQITRELIGTIGDRIAIERNLCRAGPERGEFEIEAIALTEIDAQGHLRAVIHFDVDDRTAAFTEAESRFAAGEVAAVGGQTPIAALVRAYNEHDWPTVLAGLANDFVLDDHRLLGFGTLSRDEWIESIRVHADLAPDVGTEGLRLLAWNCHGRVAVLRVFGTARDGGPFENVFVGVYLIAGDRIQRYELFDLTAADEALARFKELCAARAT